MSAKPKETLEVHVPNGNLLSTQETDRVRSVVCLLKLRSGETGTGFYVKIKRSETLYWHCIMTCWHVACKNNNVVSSAKFNYERDDIAPNEVSFQTPNILSSNEDLDYALIEVNEETMISFGIMPLLIEDPILQPSPPDTVYIFQHPGGDLKHSSSGEIEEYVPPFIKYNAETRRGSSGSPVVVKVGDSLELVAIHFEGVGHPQVSSNYNMGVVMSEIFNHIKTGNYTQPSTNPWHCVPPSLEVNDQAPRSKDPHLPVTDEDIRKISSDISKEWKQIGRVLLLPNADSIVDSIDVDEKTVYEKSYKMLTKWKRKKVSNANYEALAAAFQDLTVERGDLIPKYC